nr:immunoglobulin heavy chain junction region [Mus musculus]
CARLLREGYFDVW